MRPFSLLDVLSVVGAGFVTGERFSFRIWDIGVERFPEITHELAATARQMVSQHVVAGSIPGLEGSDADLLRGAGQMPLMAQRIARLAEIVTDEQIMGYRDTGPQALRVSLRLEDRHNSDVPAAHRAIGSEPIPRYSHPGRNLLAAVALVRVALDQPYAFTECPDLPGKPGAGASFFPRVWPVPIQPMTASWWASLLRAQNDGPRCLWMRARVRENGQAMALAPSEPFWGGRQEA